MQERIFAGVFTAGISYADREVEAHGDFKQLAFLSFSTLDLSFKEGCPAEFRPEITEHAAQVQAMRGQQYRVSTCGQTVLLGRALAGDFTEQVPRCYSHPQANQSILRRIYMSTSLMHKPAIAIGDEALAKCGINLQAWLNDIIDDDVTRARAVAAYISVIQPFLVSRLRAGFGIRSIKNHAMNLFFVVNDGFYGMGHEDMPLSFEDAKANLLEGCNEYKGPSIAIHRYPTTQKSVDSTCGLLYRFYQEQA